ncbi:hypothetical protein TNIN_372801 [Trichonephila inaurata madagascariensis]|uniref:Uncharacterized protein n=1 Tax=Trichonephila inaurata madagascariensis TaxID=2747483 RepID=A0A8X6WTG0_9ARAC|nr:hypothetical protein TNIN_372801 [Trichonephila inaurata madagascariensis]
MSHTASLDPVEALLCRLKAPSASSSVGKRTSDEQKGVAVLFYLCRSPAVGGPIGVWKDGLLLEARPAFLMSRGQVEDIIFGKWCAKPLASDHLRTAQETERLLIYATSAINFNGRSLTGFTLSLFRKGIECVCLNVTHILDPSVCVRVKSTKVRAQVLEKRTSDEQKG